MLTHHRVAFDAAYRLSPAVSRPSGPPLVVDPNPTDVISQLWVSDTEPGSGRYRSSTASSSSRGACSSRVHPPKIIVARPTGSQGCHGAMPSWDGLPLLANDNHACCICCDSVFTVGPAPENS